MNLAGKLNVERSDSLAEQEEVEALPRNRLCLKAERSKMSDQCKNCTVRGDYEKCINTECFQHESWIANQRIERINKLEAVLRKILTAHEFSSVDWQAMRDAKKLITDNQKPLSHPLAQEEVCAMWRDCEFVNTKECGNHCEGYIPAA